MSGAVVVENRADGDGGGLALYSGAVLTLDNGTTVTKNEAEDGCGGALVLSGNSSAQLASADGAVLLTMNFARAGGGVCAVWGRLLPPCATTYLYL